VNGVRAAVAAAAAAALDADPRLCVVAGAGHAILGPVLATRRGRHILALGPGSRTAVAEGVAGCRRPVLVALSGDETLGPLSGAMILITEDGAQAATAQSAGLTVTQPAWPTDAEPLLQGALRAGGPVVLRAHAQSPDSPPPPPPQDGLPRILHRGGDGLVVAAGGAVPLLAAAVGVAAAQGTALTAVDLHTVAGPGPIDPRVGDEHVWVGDREAAAGIDHDLFRVPLRVVAIAGKTPAQAAAAITAALPPVAAVGGGRPGSRGPRRRRT
jgi:hypothetical protein